MSIEIRESPENYKLLQVVVDEEVIFTFDKGLYKKQLAEIRGLSSLEEIKLFFEKNEKKRVLGYLYKLLSVRSYMGGALREKLREKKVSGAVIDEVIEHLQKLGYLDDEREIETLIRSYSRKGYGPMQIENKLRLKGKLSFDVAREKVREVVDDELQLEQIEDWIQRKFPDFPDVDRVKTQKIFLFLKRKGFDDSLIRKILL